MYVYMYVYMCMYIYYMTFITSVYRSFKFLFPLKCILQYA